MTSEHKVHRDDIREISINPMNPLHVASGGFDQNVCLTYVGRSAPASPGTIHAAPGVVGSVRWVPDESELLSWTTDDGGLQLFDTRVGRVVQSAVLEPVRSRFVAHLR